MSRNISGSRQRNSVPVAVPEESDDVYGGMVQTSPEDLSEETFYPAQTHQRVDSYGSNSNPYYTTSPDPNFPSPHEMGGTSQAFRPHAFSPVGSYAPHAYPQDPYHQNVGPGIPPHAAPPSSYGGPNSYPGADLSRNGTAYSRPLIGGQFNHSQTLPPRRQPTTLSSHSNSSRQPITRASIDEYRNRIKADPDPENQFVYAKYLIKAARKLAQTSVTTGEEAKGAKKYRDTLLQESLKIIKRLATQSTGLGKPAYADAQFFLANCLGSGSLGLQVDHEKAYNLYVQASKQNHAAATYRTAVCNEHGAGTRKDPARAVLFFRKASALGDTPGMYKLGMILLNGLLGQHRNGREAVVWLKRAAQQADEDNPHALHELGLLYEKPPDPSRPPGPTVMFDEAQALELFTQAAKLGYGPSQHRLGTAFEYGNMGCPIDPRRSIAWYTVRLHFYFSDETVIECNSVSVLPSVMKLIVNWRYQDGT